MRIWALLTLPLFAALLAGCPKEPETFDPGPRPAPRATPAPLAGGVIPGDLGSQHICWRNPTTTVDGYSLFQNATPKQAALDTVVLAWSQKVMPADCVSRIEPPPTYNDGGKSCPDWEEGSQWQGTAVPGAQVCVDINLPSGITYVAATARNADDRESTWSNVNTYDVPRPPAPPVPPQVLDPVCVISPKCLRFIGQTLHGYTTVPVVLRWRPSDRYQIDTEILTWPAGVSVQAVKLAVGDGTLRWTPKAAGQYYSRARMCQGTQCSAWVTSISPEQWVYSITAALPKPKGEEDSEDNDPSPTLDTRAAPEPPINDTPLCRVTPTCEFYSGDTVFGYVDVPISLRQVPTTYYTFGEILRWETSTLVARRILPPGDDRAAWRPLTVGRYWTQARQCTTNNMDLGQCSDYVGSKTPPLHWQYVIGPTPTGTPTGQASGEPDYDPVDECLQGEGDECEEPVEEPSQE